MIEIERTVEGHDATAFGPKKKKGLSRAELDLIIDALEEVNFVGESTERTVLIAKLKESRSRLK